MNKKYLLKDCNNNHWYFENATIEYPNVYTLDFVVVSNNSNEPYEIDFNNNKIKNTIHVFLMDNCISYWNNQTSKYKPIFYISISPNANIKVYIVEDAKDIEEAKKFIYNKNKNL